MSRADQLTSILAWQDAKSGLTDSEWVSDVTTENSDVKFDYQLSSLLVSQRAKLVKAQEVYAVLINFPDVQKYETHQALKSDLVGQALTDAIDSEYSQSLITAQWKVEKIKQSIDRIAQEIELRAKGIVAPSKSDDGTENKNIPEGAIIRDVKGTQYFIDSDNGDNTWDGLSATFVSGTNGPWKTFHQFTENARSAGDKAIARRGRTARYDSGTTDLAFVSDGTPVAPITLEADYDNVWSDQVDLSATATATIVFGSKNVTFNADVTGVLAANAWVYASGDNNRDFAYEVASVTFNSPNTDVVLYLPYKGNQAGSGKTMYNMQSAPVWNLVTGDFQVIVGDDTNWKIQGIRIQGTDALGNVYVFRLDLLILKDCSLHGNGAGDIGINALQRHTIRGYKNRFYNHTTNHRTVSGNDNGIDYCYDSLLDGNNVANSIGLSPQSSGTQVWIEDSEMKNHSQADISLGSNCMLRGRNVIMSSSVEVIITVTSGNESIGIEDYDAVVGDNRFFFSYGSASSPIYQSETTTVRSGGSNKSIKVTPSTNLGTAWEASRIKLFEIPFYATTASKTYTVYFKTNATTDWTADPTAAELWIELEAWGHATNNFRKITKSTGVIDFNGSTAWQSLTVTVAPAQAGVAYLRCYYAKTKEASKSNVFFVDPIQEVS